MLQTERVDPSLFVKGLSHSEEDRRYIMSDSFIGRRTTPSFFLMPKSVMKAEQSLNLIDDLVLGGEFNSHLAKSQTQDEEEYENFNPTIIGGGRKSATTSSGGA
jgi:hypothetical protein